MLPPVVSNDKQSCFGHQHSFLLDAPPGEALLERREGECLALVRCLC